MRSMLSLTVLVGAAALGGLAACASTGDTDGDGREPRQCFQPDAVNGFRAGDGQDVYVRAGVNDVYKLRTFGDCSDIDWASRIGIQKTAGFGSACARDDVNLLVPMGGGFPARTCRAEVVGKLSAEELEALPPRFRP